SVDSRVLRLLIVGAANWSTAWYRLGGPASVDEIADVAARMALGEIGGR
ncbi:MAG: DNA-binding transcriptional regulator, AcrR family, partial [Massilia sp.]|nr:DNA-binding transcriptional regulator, AcrR family [Massilia sp.]